MLQPEDPVCTLGLFPIPVCVCVCVCVCVSAARGPGVHGCVPESFGESLQCTFVCVCKANCACLCAEISHVGYQNAFAALCVCLRL